MGELCDLCLQCSLRPIARANLIYLIRACSGVAAFAQGSDFGSGIDARVQRRRQSSFAAWMVTGRFF
jgi:hypothetical protein